MNYCKFIDLNLHLSFLEVTVQNEFHQDKIKLLAELVCFADSKGRMPFLAFWASRGCLFLPPVAPSPIFKVCNYSPSFYHHMVLSS